MDPSSFSQGIAFSLFLMLMANLSLDVRISQLPEGHQNLKNTSSLEHVVIESTKKPTTLSPMCLGLGDDQELDQMLSRYDMVYVLSHAKVGSTTMAVFFQNCFQLQHVSYTHIFTSPTARQQYLTLIKQIPPFLSGMVIDSKHFETIVQNAATNSLIIYLHRDDTDRLRSAIRQVVTSSMGTNQEAPEQEVMDALRNQKREIGMTGNNILTCSLYESIEHNAANVVFLHYTKINQLIRLLTQHHCPDVQPTTPKNAGDTKGHKRIRLTHYENQTMDLNDWMDAKLHFLEHALEHKKGATCQGITRKMEHQLLNCPDETYWYSSHEFD